MIAVTWEVTAGFEKNKKIKKFKAFLRLLRYYSGNKRENQTKGDGKNDNPNCF